MANQGVVNPQDLEKQNFRSSFKEASIVITKLSSVCKDVNEMVELLDLAQRNDAQLELLINLMVGLQPRK